MLDRDLDVQVPNVHPKPKRGQVGDKDDWCATSLFRFLFLVYEDEEDTIALHPCAAVTLLDAFSPVDPSSSLSPSMLSEGREVSNQTMLRLWAYQIS